MKRIGGLLITAACLLIPVAGFAGVISIDENGNGIGTVGRGFLNADPGPGGLASVLTYFLPFTGTQGDVLLNDLVAPGVLVVGDVLRFNGNGTVIFYSDTPPTDSIGDTSFPGAFYTNVVGSVVEVGPEGNNGATYTPTPGQPGFFSVDTPITYQFVSDGTIPEPSSIALVGIGLGLIAFGAVRRKAKFDVRKR